MFFHMWNMILHMCHIKDQIQIDSSSLNEKCVPRVLGNYQNKSFFLVRAHRKRIIILLLLLHRFLFLKPLSFDSLPFAFLPLVPPPPVFIFSIAASPSPPLSLSLSFFFCITPPSLLLCSLQSPPDRESSISIGETHVLFWQRGLLTEREEGKQQPPDSKHTLSLGKTPPTITFMENISTPPTFGCRRRRRLARCSGIAGEALNQSNQSILY